MKLYSVIIKSLKEQVRNCWVLLLTLMMGPFFIFVYYLIVQSSKPSYDLLIVNADSGATLPGLKVNYGQEAIDFFDNHLSDSSVVPLHTRVMNDRDSAVSLISNKDADAMIYIPYDFSRRLIIRTYSDTADGIPLEISGDMSNANYLITAVWSGEIFNRFLSETTHSAPLLSLKETPLGSSGAMSDFDMIVPGILIVSLIMLMFTASIAFVSEVENKTILRLKLSGLKSWEFLLGIGAVQILVGVISMIATLLTAILLGFDYRGSLWIMLLVAGLTSISIIAFSLIIAALTKSANEVLIVGNFPMFLFMFFTGAAFPMKAHALFNVAGYPVSVQSLMSPVHAISALNKTLVMNMDLHSIIPEIIALLALSLVYFAAGAFIFSRRHMKLS